MTTTVVHKLKPPTSRFTPEDAHTSVIKWYDPVRRFGFVRPHDNRGDIWFNWLTLMRNRIQELDEDKNCQIFPDMRVTFTYEDPETAAKQRSIVFMRIEDV